MPEKMVSTGQFRRIFGLGKPLGFGKDEISDLVEEHLGFRSLKRMTFAQANFIIEKLGGQPFGSQFNSRRTENYHKQKAGIETIVTADHLEKLHKVWFEKPHRTAEGLAAL